MFPAPSAGGAGVETRHPLGVHDLISMVRLGAVAVAPGGERVAYTQKRWDGEAAKWTTSLRLFELGKWEAAGGTQAAADTTDSFTVPLTSRPHVSDSNPSFSPDGASLAFTSNRSGSSQVWVLDLDRPGEPQQLSDFPLGVSDIKWGPQQLFFCCEVYPTLSIAETAARDKDLAAQKAAGANAMSFTSLPVRHWDSWADGKRNHLFAADTRRRSGGWEIEEPADLLAGLDTDCPLKPFGGCEDYSVAPDGSSVVYCARPAAAADEAWSTNTNLFLHVLRGVFSLDTPRRGPRTPGAVVAGFSDEEGDDPDDVPSSPAVAKLGHSHAAGSLTMGNEGYDTNPRFSPDGQLVAFLSMAIPGYEADTNHLKIFDLRSGSRRRVELPPSFVGELRDIAWAPDGTAIFATADERGCSRLFRIEIAGGAVQELGLPHGISGMVVVPPSNHRSTVAETTTVAVASEPRLVFLQASFHAPAELYTCTGAGLQLTKLSAANDEKLGQIQFGPEPTEIFCQPPLEGEGESGAVGKDQPQPVHSWLFQPLGFDPADTATQYPMAVIVHGGPQGAVQDTFSYRWNPAIYAAAGYVVLCVNFRGSAGFGAKFREAVSKDWAGGPYRDGIAATDHALDTLSHVDKERVGALGASFGGYMINLINGRNSQRDEEDDGKPPRYRCLVNHDGTHVV